MPYFKNKDINKLFIHVPKTGGTSVELYFTRKFDIPLGDSSLYSFFNPLYEKPNNNIGINTSFQHMTYNTIMQYKDYFNIDDKDLEILSIVRNPYHRVMSDLFFLEKITKHTSKEDVYIAMREYIEVLQDNHGLPQYLFLMDENNELIRNIKLMRTESLQSDMINLGYVDFDIKFASNTNNVNYDDYLNIDSINLINNYYEKDFEIFGYSKIENI